MILKLLAVGGISIVVFGGYMAITMARLRKKWTLAKD
jgi:hypothetical protein